MSRIRYTFLGTTLLLLAVPALASGNPPQASASAPKASSDSAPKAQVSANQPKMTPQTRILIIRDLTAEHGFARHIFPQGEKGLVLRNGKLSPSEAQIAQLVAENGPAAQPGDKCVISNVLVKDKSIVVEINGGPKKRQKWYKHIQVGMNGGMTNVGGPDTSLNVHGSVVTLEFDSYVPELTGDQVRELLAPVLDFKALSVAEAYEKTLPPKVQEAIKNHQVLVGMDKDMVVYAKGRAPSKIRDKDEQGHDYEEWIYGTPPQEVDFVRFSGNIVSRLEIMTVDGQKIVRTEKEIDLKSEQTEVAQKKAPPPANAPSLRRPGEDQWGDDGSGDMRTTIHDSPDTKPMPPQKSPPAPSGPTLQPTDPATGTTSPHM